MPLGCIYIAYGNESDERDYIIEPYGTRNKRNFSPGLVRPREWLPKHTVNGERGVFTEKWADDFERCQSDLV